MLTLSSPPWRICRAAASRMRSRLSAFSARECPKCSGSWLDALNVDRHLELTACDITCRTPRRQPAPNGHAADRRRTRMTAAAVPVGRVRQERHGHILKIVLDNPAKMNAFSPEMME